MYSEYYCTLPDAPWGDPLWVGVRNTCVGKNRQGGCYTIGHPERLNCPWRKVKAVTLPVEDLDTPVTTDKPSSIGLKITKIRKPRKTRRRKT